MLRRNDAINSMDIIRNRKRKYQKYAVNVGEKENNKKLIRR